MPYDEDLDIVFTKIANLRNELCADSCISVKKFVKVDNFLLEILENIKKVKKTMQE